MSEEEILIYSYDYLMSGARGRKYNLQFIAINNYFNKKENYPKLEDYNLDYDDFIKKYESFCVRDFVYKKDYYSTREMYLISPSHYLYYTFNVFKYFYGNQERLNFSKNNIKVFYSGLLSFSDSNIYINSNYSNSYNKFQSEKLSFVGGRALVLDIQDFFKNISTKTLIEKLFEYNRSSECEKSINNLDNFFKVNNFGSLPQLHYSISSSVLSQFYLISFTEEMNNILADEDCKAVRFVDDMVISLPKNKRKKKMNEVLNKLTYYLWKDRLNLNSSKTKFLETTEYEKLVTLLEPSYSDEISSNYVSNKIIDDKVDWLLKNQAQNLIEFFDKLRKCFLSYSVDLEEYHNYINEYIAIDGDHATKVINHLIFGKKWHSLDKEVLIKLVEDNTYVFFNPMQFTTFFLLVIKHLKLLGYYDPSILDNFINELKNKNALTFREGVITIQYFLQMKLSDKELITKMEKINKKYVEFLIEFYNV